MNLDPPMSQDSLLDTLRDSDQPGLAAREFLEAVQARLDAWRAADLSYPPTRARRRGSAH